METKPVETHPTEKIKSKKSLPWKSIFKILLYVLIPVIVIIIILTFVLTSIASLSSNEVG
jgi:hypothetical protein